MSQQLINIGTADQGNGDPIRTAFNKVNENFTELFEQVSASVVVDTTPPAAPSEGNLWWDPEGGRLYISYDSNWIDASPVDGVGISSTNELVNGAYTVSLGSNGTVTFPDLLTIANSVIGKSSSVTVTEETTDGTISQTTTTESQIEIEAESIVIAKRVRQVTDDTVVVTTDEAGSSVTVNNSGVFIKKYAEPDGPNNTSYFQVRTNNGAILEAVEENVADETYGRVIAAQGVVEIATRADGVEKNWGFSYDGTMVVPTNSTVLGTNDLTIRTESDGNSGLFLNSSPLVGTAVLYATNNAIITADYDGNRKDWNFDKSGTITVPLLLPKIFTAVLDEEHMVVPITLEGDPWQYGVEFAVNPDGSVQTQMDDPNPTVDPGYVQGSVFRFTEADHGIPGYTFDITLNFTFDEEAEVFVTNPSVTAPPEYPATVESPGAIKLSATGSTVVPGQQIIASDAQGGITNDYITVWVEGGGTNYPEIVAVQPGWTVVGEGLNYVSVTNAELITQFPGSVIYRITTAISSAKMGYEYTFIEPDSSEPDLQNWVFGTDGQLTVPGAIFRDGGLYMNSSGSTTAASVFVSGNSGGVILRTADNAQQVSYDLTLDVNGETSFPGRLNFSDGSTLGDNILTGAVDSDLGLEIKRMVTVSGAHMGPNSPDVLLVDITEDDDITIVQAGWELNTGSEIAPIWLPVETVSRNENIYYLIAVSGVTFETGVTYTFRNPVPESQTWFIRNQTGGLVAPGGAIITNETAPLGGGGTYRELAIELPTPDELNEHRWVFDNDGDFTTPGNITVTGGLFTTYGVVVDVAVNADNYLGLHANPNAGVLVRSSDTELNYSDWKFEVGGSVTFPDTSVQTTAYPGTLAAARLPYYDNTEARDTAITSPENGMIVIVGGDVYFYGAAQWRQLTVAA
jgi:hypothetical protein